MRSDHCWSHGRGRPSASFHAGSWIARARASRPSVTASASSTIRCTLFSGWASVRPERVDLHAVAEAQAPRVLHAVALAPELLPQHRHRAQLGVLLDEAHAGVDEERDAPEDLFHQLLSLGAARAVVALVRRLDALARGVEHGDRVAHRVGDLLHRRRSGLLQVVGADVDRVPLGHVLDRVGDHVGDQPHRRRRREGVGAAREELLDDVVLRRALQRLLGDALILGGDDVQRQQPGGRRVDRHRRVHLVQRDAVHQRGHVAAVGDRHADLADLAARELVVGVIAGLRRQVEGHRQARLALGEVAPVQLVGRLRRRVPGVGAHHPRPVALGQARGVIAAHASIVRLRRALYPFERERDRRAAARRRPGQRPGRRVEGDRAQRQPQHLRARGAHARALHPRRQRSTAATRSPT